MTNPRAKRRSFDHTAVRLAVVAALFVALSPVASSARDPFLRRTAAVRAVQKSGPAVVNITTEQLVSTRSPFRRFGGDPFFDSFFRDFYEPLRSQTVQNLGSGVVIDKEGHILTNEHVVARANRIRVTMADGREFDANVLGADPNNDIAVLKVDTDESLPWIPPHRSEDLMVGEPVIAIGNPFGLSNSVTTGVISAINRSIRSENHTFHGFLQTDASINPGNSGGPLLNANGQLIGINTAVHNGGQGIGFAIPIDVATRVVNELIAHGEVSPVWIGLEFQDVGARMHEALGLPEGTSGALVNRVRSDSPAEAAGIRRGDVVTHVENRPVLGARPFFEMLESVTVGQKLRTDLWRDGGTRRVTLHAEKIPDDLVDRFTQEMLGLEIEPRHGSFVIAGLRPGSSAANIGMRPGDYVLAINGRALEDEDALRRSILGLRGRDRALLVVQRGNGRYHVTLPVL
ncbi:MAG: trypsin-like peptidase domain-containing protein [Myxococcales bacterium]|nr:trypsin-like peptidase domain-containing protein [Myxococcales bacterium]